LLVTSKQTYACEDRKPRRSRKAMAGRPLIEHARISSLRWPRSAQVKSKLSNDPAGRADTKELASSDGQTEDRNVDRADASSGLIAAATPRPAGSLSAPFRRVAILPATLRANRDETWLRLHAMVWVPDSVDGARGSSVSFSPLRST
jgi:hypothetical protein